MTMKFAVLPPVRAGVCADPDWMIGFARHAEDCGFESIVLVEHPVVVSDYTSRYPYASSGRMPLADDCRIPDPIDVLGFLAAVTTRLVLSTGVLVLPAHHPVIMAKRLATLDALSKGRVRLCIGVGWMREELEACGIDFASRGRRTDASCGPTPSRRERRSRGSSSASPTPTPIRSPTAPAVSPSTSVATAGPPSGGRRGAATVGTRSGSAARS